MHSKIKKLDSTFLTVLNIKIKLAYTFEEISSFKPEINRLPLFENLV